jgi:hypothetical protein
LYNDYAGWAERGTQVVTLLTGTSRPAGNSGSSLGRGLCGILRQPDGPTRRQAHDFTIAGSVPLPGIFRDRVNVETKLRGMAFAYLSDFINNGIR